MRGFDSTGLVFFTNYSSCKGEQLAENPNAAVCFWWWELQQQVRIEGRVERVSPAESDDYFYSRPEESRRASAASPQSQVIASREELERAAAESDGKRPVNWGGFRLAPTLFEFWQGRTARLHDRFRYRKEDGVWVIERLAP